MVKHWPISPSSCWRQQTQRWASEERTLPSWWCSSDCCSPARCTRKTPAQKTCRWLVRQLLSKMDIKFVIQREALCILLTRTTEANSTTQLICVKSTFSGCAFTRSIVIIIVFPHTPLLWTDLLSTWIYPLDSLGRENQQMLRTNIFATDKSKEEKCHLFN